MFIRISATLNLPSRGVLRSKEAEVLRQDVRAAHERLQQAQDEYEKALAIAADIDLGPEGLFIMYRQGHAYATAVLTYSDAVMAMLSYMETGRGGRADRKQTAMALILQPRPRDGFLLATATGKVSFESADESCRDMLNLAARLGLRKILFDCLAVQGDLSIEERFELGKNIAEYCQSKLNVPAVALIGKPPSVTGYGATVATKHGMPVEMFSDRQRGLEWLKSLP